MIIIGIMVIIINGEIEEGDIKEIFIILIVTIFIETPIFLKFIQILIIIIIITIITIILTVQNDR